TTCPRHCRVLPSSTRRANSNAFPSSSRRGGAKRRGGGFEAPQDHLSATLSRPALLHVEGKNAKHSPPRTSRGGAQHRGGEGRSQARPPWPRHCRGLPA